MNFNIQAATWDSEQRVQRAKLIAAQIADVVELKRDYSALEFGCGTGLISFNLAEKLNDITCIDTSQGMIAVLNSKIEQYGVHNMTAYQRDINQDCLPAVQYDLIYTSMVLHHISDIDTILTRLEQLLKSGGYLCIIELDEDDGSFHKLEQDFQGHHGFNQEQLKIKLENVGLAEVRSDTFFHDSKLINGVNVNYSLFSMIGKKCK